MGQSKKTDTIKHDAFVFTGHENFNNVKCMKMEEPAGRKARTVQKDLPAKKNQNDFIYASSKKTSKKLSNKTKSLKDCDECRNVFYISELPYVIKESGKYVLTKDLTNTEDATAILIDGVSDVEIDFCKHSITLEVDTYNVEAINIKNGQNAYIHNGNIISVNKYYYCVGIFGQYYTNLLVENMNFRKIGTAVYIKFCVDFTLKNSYLYDQGSINFFEISGSGTTIDQVQIYNEVGNAGILFMNNDSPNINDSSTNINIRNLELYNAAIILQVAIGAIIEHVNSIFNDSTSYIPVLQLGVGILDANVYYNTDNIIVKNCNFNNINSNIATTCAIIASGSNILIDNCNFRCNNLIPDENLQGSVILFGNAAFSGDVMLNNVKLSNCNVSGTSNICVAFIRNDTSHIHGIVIENNNITSGGPYTGVLLNNIYGVLFKNNTIHNNRFGIVLLRSNICSFFNNQIYNNISVGIGITSESRSNLFKENLICTTIGGISDSGSNTTLVDNVIFNN